MHVCGVQEGVYIVHTCDMKRLMTFRVLAVAEECGVCGVCVCVCVCVCVYIVCM